MEVELDSLEKVEPVHHTSFSYKSTSTTGSAFCKPLGSTTSQADL